MSLASGTLSIRTDLFSGILKTKTPILDAIEKIITDFENFCQDNGSI